MAGLMDKLKEGAQRFGVQAKEAGEAALKSPPIEGVKEVGGKILKGAGKAKDYLKESKDDAVQAYEITKEGIKAANPFGGNAAKGKKE